MVTDSAFYRNPAYHTGELNYPAMARVVEGLIRAVMVLESLEWCIQH